MQLTFNTSEGRKELPVNLVGTLELSMPYRDMISMLGYVTDLNGGRIGYDTFCHRVVRAHDLIMPAANNSANVIIHPIGYDGQSNVDDLLTSDSMYTVAFLVFEPIVGKG